ncbi:DUF4259 domain-containing protein [Nonomuraea sp. CA-143628]|uniref:DUF4259 domain-containing protein n=1 Tax=Nonomuraea sp. CA-143628 TaxID=3239997 RepID=UPI003D924813
MVRKALKAVAGRTKYLDSDEASEAIAAAAIVAVLSRTAPVHLDGPGPFVVTRLGLPLLWRPRVTGCGR